MKRIVLAVACICLPTSAMADISVNEKQYTEDRKQAIEQFTPEMGKYCLENFSDKRNKQIEPMGVAAYNDSISRGVYKTVFWNHSDRGVAFTLPVKAQLDKDRVATGDIACLYSVRGNQLYFELSQQLF